jgi:glucan-binding YG repeat protein
MAEKNTRTSRLLMCTSFLVCVAAGGLITQPSATPSPLTDESRPDMIVADAVETESLPEEIVDELVSPSPTAAEEPETAEDTPTETPEALPEETSAPEVTEAPEETVVPKETEAPEKEPETDSAAKEPEQGDESETGAQTDGKTDYTASPEAASGTWVYYDSSWYFRVGDDNHHGWLYDTDHHVYYFDPRDGSMVTGWRDINGRRYYFDADGIMQTGRVKVDGQYYHMQEDGSLEGYEAPVEVPEEPAPEDKSDAE